jgi:peroxiredoxin (alkyl hydroperoxide reductase subunit C)
VQFPTWAPTANGDPREAFGIWNGGFALRGAYLIAPDGKLMTSEVNFLNLGRNIGRDPAQVQSEHLPRQEDDRRLSFEVGRTRAMPRCDPGPEMVGRVHEALHKK